MALTLLAAYQTQAQGLRLGTGQVVAGNAAAPLLPAQADFIVAVVDSEPITNHEVRQQTQLVLQQLAKQGRPAPDVQALATQVLDDLINQKAQLHFARDTNLQVETSAIDDAEKSVAAQNRLDVTELHRRIAADGLTIEQFRDQLRDQIALQRLHEREVTSRLHISDQEVAQYLREQQANLPAGDVEINLAQILVSVPASATAIQVDALKARAERALVRARKGEDFAALVREFSDATDLTAGGQLGLRTASRYPNLFVTATQQLGVGDVADLVRSPAGFHVLKVVEEINPKLPTMAVTQSHARHILLIPGATLSQSAARQKLVEFKKQLVNGQADFATLAREYSQDGSATKGGDLGWSSPGMFVPEFESVMNRLAPGEISDPLLSRFGLHLIQLVERRKASLEPEQQREAVRALLREKKYAQAYNVWAQDVRARAYVELRSPPL